jgi:hypothetical protein
MKQTSHLLLAFIISYASPLVAFEGDTDLLRVIADGYEVSWENFRTWEGSAFAEISEVRSVSDGTIQEGWKRHIEMVFVCDNDSNASRWVSSFTDTTYSSGKTERRDPLVYSGMVKGNQGFQMVYEKSKERGLRTLDIFPVDDINRSEYGLSFDPQYVWKNVHPNIIGVLRNWYEERNDITSGHSIIRKGNIITITSILPGSAMPGGTDDQELSNVLVFDLSQGCNLVELKALNPASDVTWNLEYENINGVFVPKNISKEHKIKNQGSAYFLYFKARFDNKMVNEPVDPVEFEFDKIGLREGDRIIDRGAAGVMP